MRETEKYVQRRRRETRLVIKKQERRELEMREDAATRCQMPPRKGEDGEVHIVFSSKEVNSKK